MRDPTRDEMLAFLKSCQTYGDESDMTFEIEEAIYWFAYDFHGGQWSNLYEALCHEGFHPGPYATQPADPYLYDCLVEEYAND